jgi:hypothetical protein
MRATMITAAMATMATVDAAKSTSLFLPLWPIRKNY